MESQREEHRETQTKLTSMYDDVIKNVESEMKETQGQIKMLQQDILDKQKQLDS